MIEDKVKETSASRTNEQRDGRKVGREDWKTRGAAPVGPLADSNSRKTREKMEGEIIQKTEQNKNMNLNSEGLLSNFF